MPNSNATVSAKLSSLLPASIFVFIAATIPTMMAGGSLSRSWRWAPSMGVYLDMRADGLSVLMGLIISGIGFFVVLYAAEYLRGHRHYGRFFAFLHLFLLSMLGLVFSDNLISLFVFWELTTVLSYLLIGFENDDAAARDSARQALLVTGAGGLVLLIGFLYIGQIAETFRISAIAGVPDMLRHHPGYLLILATVFIGAFTKSAQFPFHFWLPNAMTAPAPISAFLHSATMVKAGIYLLARFHPILGGTTVWMGTLVVVGGGTALWGAIVSIGQSDLKKILAYTTLMALGILTMFLGGQTTPALTAAVTFLLVHSLYKSTLFLVVGIIDHETGTRDIARLGGLARLMPYTAFGAATAAMSMAGFPLFLGFVGKEIMYKGALAEEMFPVFATTAAVSANALMAAVAGIVIVSPFLGKQRRTPKAPHEAPPTMWIGPLTIGAACLFFGIIPDWVGRTLIQPAVFAIHPTMEEIKLQLFHGFNEPLLLSVLTMAVGGCIFIFRRRIHLGVAFFTGKIPVTGHGAYSRTMTVVAQSASRVTGIVQNGSLHRYLLTIVTVFAATTAGLWLMNAREAFVWPNLPSLPFSQWLLAVLIIAAAGVVVVTRSRLTAICALGVVGSGSALIFFLYGAPDLALTQLLVETLTLIIVSILLLRLPAIGATAPSQRRRRWVDGLAATAVGVLITGLTMVVCAGDLDRSVTAFFERNSVPIAHGRNIVNVILVDFRSLDTLGEIVVVAVAGLAGLSLLARKKKRSD